MSADKMLQQNGDVTSHNSNYVEPIVMFYAPFLMLIL